MKVSTSVYASIEVEVDEYEDDKARYFTVHYPKGLSFSELYDVRRHLREKYNAFPKNPDAMRPRVFVAWE